MGKIVAAFTCGHTALMIRRYDAAEPGMRARVMKGFQEVRRRLEEARPDALLVVATDHLKTFFLDNMPSFCLGVGEECSAWGEGGVPKYKVKVHRPFAGVLLESLIQQGFDMAFSEEMPLDHAFMTPLHFIRPEMDLPIIPLFQNCSVPPQPRPERCYALGEAIGRAVEADAKGMRLALLGTGGLSHWVGRPEMGTINAEFDRHILELIREGRGKDLSSLDFREVEGEAGNGANEIRNWITVLGAMVGGRGEVLAYEPVEAWATGIGIVAYPNKGDGK
jgi:aromatic ring-opening dioxygenase catalytic subunit (LigB family)